MQAKNQQYLALESQDKELIPLKSNIFWNKKALFAREEQICLRHFPHSINTINFLDHSPVFNTFTANPRSIPVICTPHEGTFITSLLLIITSIKEIQVLKKVNNHIFLPVLLRLTLQIGGPMTCVSKDQVNCKRRKQLGKKQTNTQFQFYNLYCKNLWVLGRDEKYKKM